MQGVQGYQIWHSCVSWSWRSWGDLCISAFLCISLHFSAFLYISLHFSAFYISNLGQFDGRHFYFRHGTNGLHSQFFHLVFVGLHRWKMISQKKKTILSAFSSSKPTQIDCQPVKSFWITLKTFRILWESYQSFWHNIN